MSRAKPIPAKTRRALQERSGGVCEGCGRREATEAHHRKYLSRGGVHSLDNLAHLCGMGNVQSAGCHGIAHSAEGGELGWSVNSWNDPALVPVLYRGVMKWLTPQGLVVDVGEDPGF